MKIKEFIFIVLFNSIVSAEIQRTMIILSGSSIGTGFKYVAGTINEKLLLISKSLF